MCGCYDAISLLTVDLPHICHTRTCCSPLLCFLPLFLQVQLHICQFFASSVIFTYQVWKHHILLLHATTITACCCCYYMLPLQQHIVAATTCYYYYYSMLQLLLLLHSATTTFACSQYTFCGIQLIHFRTGEFIPILFRAYLLLLFTTVSTLATVW